MYRPRQKQHYLEEAAVDALCSYFWPGSVRQLRHVIERLAATANDGDPLTVATVRRPQHLSSFTFSVKKVG